MVTTPNILPGVKEVVPMDGTIRERLLAYHRQGVQSAEDFFQDQVAFEANEAIMRGQQFSPREFAQRVKEASIEDGSVYAVFRDRLGFHRAAVAYLEGLPA